MISHSLVNELELKKRQQAHCSEDSDALIPGALNGTSFWRRTCKKSDGFVKEKAKNPGKWQKL